MRSSPGSWSITLEEAAQKKVKQPQDKSQLRPQPFAVAVETVSPTGRPEESEGAKLVVFGDSEMFSDGYLSDISWTIFVNSINWLTGQRKLIDIPPKVLDNTPILLSSEHMNLLFVLLVVTMPSVIFFGGLGYTLFRRRTR